MGWARCVIYGIVFLFSIEAAEARSGVVSPELQVLISDAWVGESFPVIVVFERHESVAAAARRAGGKRKGEVARALRERSEKAQKEVRHLLERRGEPFRDLWIINGLALDADVELIELLADRPEVVEIRPDGVVPLPELQPAQVHEEGWNLAMVGAPELWGRGIDGAGVVVAVLDTGVDLRHPALFGRWRGGANSWFDPFGATPEPYDVDGHGTAVAGIIVGNSIGVAPGALWIAAKVFPDDGTSPPFALIHEAFQWILLNEDPPDIVNISWGLGPAGSCNEEFRPAIQALQSAGILVIAAAGNNGPAAVTGVSPGNYPESLSAGAVDSNRVLAGFSSRGPGACDTNIFPDVTAPGVNVLSALAGFDLLHPFSGTSFAAPHIAGVLALLRHEFPHASTRLLEHALVESASDLGPAGPDNGYGVGLVDAAAAGRWLEAPPPLLITPFAAFVPFGSVPPQGSATKEISFFNPGEDPLSFELQLVSPAFFLAESDCPEALLPGAACRAVVRFSPGAIGPHLGNLEIAGASPGQLAAAVHLEGIGNTPPLPARLLIPEQGALLSSPVTFRWQTPPDPDGHGVIDSLLVSRSIGFSDALAENRVKRSEGILLAGAGSLLFALGSALLLRRGGRLFGVLLIGAVVVGMAACGGGSSESPAFAQAERALEPGTYFWKVLTEDELGESVSSAVRTFTVQ